MSLYDRLVSDHPGARGCTISNREIPVIDLYDHISRQEYVTFFDKLEFAYTRTIDLGNEFWRFLEINGNQHLCLYHQLNKQFIMYKPDMSLLSFPWPYDGIVDISWSQTTSTWAVATQTQIVRLAMMARATSSSSLCSRSYAIIHSAKSFNPSTSAAIGPSESPRAVRLSFTRTRSPPRPPTCQPVHLTSVSRHAIVLSSCSNDSITGSIPSASTSWNRRPYGTSKRMTSPNTWVSCATWPYSSSTINSICCARSK